MEVKKIMTFGKLQCPFLVRLQTRDTHNVTVGFKQEHKKVDGKLQQVEVPIQSTFVKSGFMDICSNPADKINVGDLVQGQGALFVIDKIIEERDSRGYYPFFDFIPFWQRCEVSYHKLTKEV